MDEPTLLKTPPARLRLRHAQHFLSQYRMHSGPPQDAYWLMAGYFDAFLFSLASVWDMSKPPIRAQLEEISSFRFVKALRNIAAHHSILAVGALGNKFPRPFSREVNASMGGAPNDSSRLFFRLDVLRQILDAVERERPREKKNIDTARAYITGSTTLRDMAASIMAPAQRLAQEFQKTYGQSPVIEKILAVIEKRRKAV